MQRTQRSSRRVRRACLAAVAGAAILAPTLALPAQARPDPVVDWLTTRAVPIRDLDRPGRDLAVLRQATKDAEIVGLGESAHAVEDVTELKTRAVRFLVEQQGFRSLAWEDDWTLGLQINDYIHGHRNDRDALLNQMSPVHRTREVADLLTWLRHYNRTHRETVSFVGVEYFSTRPLAYDAVNAYVAEHAPDLAQEVSTHLERITPDSDDMKAHLTWYGNEVKDGTHGPYLESARAVHRIVSAVPHSPEDREHALALHHARQIRSWYTAFALPWEDIPAYRDARAAENLRWWQRYSEDKVIYWAHTAHTADAPDLAIHIPGGGATTFASVGSFLDDWYGDRYVRIGYTFDRGTTIGDDGRLVHLPPADGDWFEAPLGDVPRHRYIVDLGQRSTPQVGDWLDAPMLTRGDPSATSSTITGATPGDWYDVVVHTQRVNAASPLR